VALACIPSVALAAVEPSGQRPLPAPGTDHVRTDCPRGQVITGGGFAIKPNGIAAGSARSRPPGRTAWESQAFGILAPSSSWRNFAVCEPGGRRAVSIATKTELIERFGADPVARCRRGRHAIGGGWAVQPPRDPATDSGSTLGIVQNARASRRTWKLFGVGDLPSDGKLTAYALCERDRRGAVSSASQRLPLHQGNNELAASCPRGKRVVSGGFSWFGALALVYESRPGGRRAWRAGVRVVGPPDSDSFLKVIAYCKAS
jgi:hypothetical protein